MGNKSRGINAQETTNMKFIFCIIQYQKAFEKKNENSSSTDERANRISFRNNLN